MFMYMFVYVMYICILNNQFANNSLPKTFDYAYVRLIHLVIKYVLYATNNILPILAINITIYVCMRMCMDIFLYMCASVYVCV